jgi:hypothetical protein
VLLDQLAHEPGHAVVGRFHEPGLGAREHDALDVLDARRRALEAGHLRRRLDRLRSPLHHAGAADGLAAAPDHADLGLVAVGIEVAVVVLGHRLGGGALVGHDQLDAGRPRLVGVGGDREQRRQRAAQRLGPALDRARGRDRAAAPVLGRDDLVDPAHAGDLRQVELLGRLGADLGGVAIDGLPAAQDQVGPAQLAHGLGQRVAGGQRVGPGERLVGQQHDLVGAAEQRLAQHLHGSRRAHRQHGHPPAVAFLQAQRLFEGVQVFGVEDGRQRRPVDRPVLLHGLAGHVGRVGNLLDQDDDAQAQASLLVVAAAGPSSGTRRGPAAATSGDATPSYWAKLSANMRARRAAASS